MMKTNQLHHTPFDAQSSLSRLLLTHYDLLMVITRFKIPLGFGEKTIGEVCVEHNVHAPTILSVINMISTGSKEITPEVLPHLSAEALIDYLQQSHHYFLDYKLPTLRNELVEATADGPSDVVALITRFYDAYVEEVHKHMGYEDTILFPYVKKLLEGSRDPHYSIEEFERRHDHIEMKITDLKNILIKYYPSSADYYFTHVLHELFTTESDLRSHNHIEDFLFVPLIHWLEQQHDAPAC